MKMPFGLKAWSPSFLRLSVNPFPLFILLAPLWVVKSCGDVQPDTRQEINDILLGNNVVATTGVIPLVADGRTAATIRITASPPVNTSYTIVGDLIDANNKPVLQFDKEGWRQVGTWYEEGYSGTYDEADRHLWLRFKPKISGDYRLKLKSEYFLDLKGAATNSRLPVTVVVTTSQFNGGLLFVTFIASAFLAICFLRLTYFRGRLCYGGKFKFLSSKSRNTRGIYDAGLVSLKLKGRYGYTSARQRRLASPRQYRVILDLAIQDSFGEILFKKDVIGWINFIHSESDEYFTVWMPCLFFRLDQPASLRFRISMPAFVERPDFIEQEWIQFELRDRVVVPWPVGATRIN